MQGMLRGDDAGGRACVPPLRGTRGPCASAPPPPSSPARRAPCRRSQRRSGVEHARGVRMAVADVGSMESLRSCAALQVCAARTLKTQQGWPIARRLGRGTKRRLRAVRGSRLVEGGRRLTPFCCGCLFAERRRARRRGERPSHTAKSPLCARLRSLAASISDKHYYDRLTLLAS